MRAYSVLGAIVIVAALSSFLSGCSTGSASMPPVFRLNTATKIVRPSTTGTLVYVCGAAASTCVWFPLKSQTIGGTIEVQDPGMLAVDSVGNVYIPQPCCQQVAIFAKGSSTQLGTLADRGERPNDVAVTRDGTVYVANFQNLSNGNGSVSVYQGGALKRVINDPNFTQVYSVAVDEHHLLIACYANSVIGGCDEFPGGRGIGVNVISGLVTPAGVKFDGNENIVVNDNGSLLTSVYPPSGGTACNTIPQVFDPVGIAFDQSHKHLFVADSFNNDVHQETFPGCSGSASNVFTYNTGWAPSGVAVDPGPNP